MKRFIYTLACLVLSIGAWAQGEVAQIGETKYATLAEAVAAVPTDGTETTITMLANVDLGTAYITIPATKNVVLELNGKTITGSAKSYGTLRPAGKFIINGEGTIQSTTKYAIQTTANTADVVLNGATLESTTNSAVSASKGTFTMNSGIVSASSHAIEGGAVIKGGTVTSTNGYGVYANSSSAECVIEGGSITGAASKGAVGVYLGNVKVTSEPTLSSKIVFTDNATGLILPETAAAYIDNTKANLAVYDDETLLGYTTAYTTGTIASGKTVKVIADINTSNYMNIAAIKLDLNGHNITSTAQAAIVIQGSSVALTRNVTITGEGNVSCSNASGCNAVQIGKHANVTIEGGNYSVPGDNAAIYIVSSVASNPSTVTITGGYFESGDGKWIVNCNDNAYKNGGANIVIKGGSFSADPSQFLSEGEGTNFLDIEYKPVLDSDGHYSVVARDFVAQIGDVKYESLAEAIAATFDGVETTIALLANTTENVTIPAGKNITLDLNGNTLSGGSVASNGKKAAIMNNGTITIQDSSDEQTGTIKREDDDTGLSASNSYYVIDNQGTMTIKSGNVINNAGVPGAHKGSSLIRNGEPNTAVLNIEGGTITQDNFDVIKNGGNGTLNITGGTINSANSYAVLSYSEMNMSAGTINGKVCLRSYTDKDEDTHGVGNITGGTINGNITVEVYKGNTPNTLSECNISGDAVINGTFSVGEGNGNEFVANDEKGTIAVSGGSFKYEVPEKYCAPGYSPITTADADGMYTVETTKVAMVGENRYASIQEAVDAAEDGQTVKLIADVDISKTIVVDKKITLDLDGHTIYNTQDIWDGGDWSLISVRETGDLTITGNGKLSSKADDCYAVDVYDVGAKLTIENGEFVGNLSAVYVYEGEAIIKGGKYSIIQKDDQYAGEPNAFLLNCLDESRENGTATITVIGGEFEDYDPQNNKAEGPNTNVVPKEYATEKNADGNFTIIPAVAYIEKKGFKTLDAAIEEAKQAESATTITLLADAETEKETLPANVTIDANGNELTMPSFVVLDGEAYTLPNITGADTYKVHTATYIRTNISATEWGTVCLPFSLTNGNGADYYTYDNISGSTLTVDETTSTVVPNTPVVFKKTTEELVINEENATVSLVTPTTLVSGALVGTYTDANITADGKIYFINGNLFHQAQVSVKVPMYRAYIKDSTSSGAKPRTLSIVVADNDATAIEALDTDATISAIYDAAGRKISAPQKGINIMKLANGKTVKVMIK